MTKRKDIIAEEAARIRKAVETAGLVFGEFENDCNVFSEFGDDVYRRWGGWNREGDWVVAGNSIEEIQAQLSRLDETMGN